MVNSCTSRKLRVQRISLVLSNRPTISVSVEFFVFNFCLVEELDTAPRPRVKMAPVCPWQLPCDWCEASTYHQMIERDSAKRVSLREQVLWRYVKTHLSFPQSSSSGCFTLVVRKETGVWISWSTRDRNRSLAVVWWKFHAWSLGSWQASVKGRTAKRWSAAGVEVTPVIFSGKENNNFVYVWNHIKFHHARIREVNVNAQIIMKWTPSRSEYIFRCVVTSCKPGKESSDCLGFCVTN